MPAAAVIPAPIAYIKVVVVKKLIVGFRSGQAGLLRGEYWPTLFLCRLHLLFNGVGRESGMFTLKKLEYSRQASA